MYVVRYADDFVMGFQNEQDARAMHEALAERLAQFGLELHPEKTRVIEFGRFAREDRDAQGLAKPETFDFLGFTHICSVQPRWQVPTQAPHLTEEETREARASEGRNPTTPTPAESRNSTPG